MLIPIYFGNHFKGILNWGLAFFVFASLNACYQDLAEIQIVSRQQWGANPAIQAMTTHTPQHITLHHSGVASKQGDKALAMKKLQAYSQQNAALDNGKTKPAWADVPYHYVIYADGQILEGREAQFAGDTNTDYDPKGHVLICLDGNFEVEMPSPEQLSSLKKLLQSVSQRYQIPNSEIKTHQDYAETLCPGKNLLEILQSWGLN